MASATADPWIPGGPWDAQAHAVKVLVDMRDEIVFMRRALTNHLPVHPKLDALRERTTAMEQDIIRLQRDLARPIFVPFEIKPVKGKE
jgi:hypothetical protein